MLEAIEVGLACSVEFRCQNLDSDIWREGIV